MIVSKWSEVSELHRKVCKRMRELNKMKLFEKLQSFDIGEQVSFKDEGNTITGTIIRINQKSLTIKTKEGSRWYVDPRMVTKIYLTQERKDGNIYNRIQAGCSGN